MAVNSKNGFKRTIRSDYEELKYVVKECAKILKEQGEAVTREALIEMIMLRTEWTNYEDLDNDVDFVLNQIKEERSHSKRIEVFFDEAKQFAKTIVEPNGEIVGGEALRKALRDHFLEKYKYVRTKNGSEEIGMDLIKLESEKDLIINAIEHELKRRGCFAKDIVLAWEDRMIKYYGMKSGYTSTLLQDMVKCHEYPDEYGEARWRLDERYIRFAAHCVADKNIEREENKDIRDYIGDIGLIVSYVGDELDHLIK